MLHMTALKKAQGKTKLDLFTEKNRSNICFSNAHFFSNSAFSKHRSSEKLTQCKKNFQSLTGRKNKLTQNLTRCTKLKWKLTRCESFFSGKYALFFSDSKSVFF